MGFIMVFLLRFFISCFDIFEFFYCMFNILIICIKKIKNINIKRYNNKYDF